MDERVQVMMVQQRRSLWKVAQAALDAYENPLPDSPAHIDQEWARSHGHTVEVVGALTMGVRAAAIILDSADQHFMAAKAILAADMQMPLPAMTCIRGVHEAVLAVCNLFESRISPEERLARSVAGFLASIQGGVRVLHEIQDLVPDPEELAGFLKSREDAIRYFKRIGVEVHLNRAGHPMNVRYQDHVANLIPKATDLSKKHVPSLHYMYSLHSGAAHSQPWFLEGVQGQWDTILRSVVTPIFDLSDALAVCLLDYVGLSTDEIHAKTHFRRIAIMDGQEGKAAPLVHWRDYIRKTMPQTEHG